MMENTRRGLLRAGSLAFAAAGIAAPAGAKEDDAKEVGAVEDLMREHGVLRRILLIYVETAPKLLARPASLDAAALHGAAKLFHDFGEEYHERKLEEAFIFPRVRKAGGAGAAYVDVLLDQHRRGREITQYILSATAGARIATAATAPLAHAFQTFALMYQNHTAREDTIVFPAWKEALSARELAELGDRFEDIEKAQFGGDGFENAVERVGDIERTLGLADLSQFTAPPPPRSRP